MARNIYPGYCYACGKWTPSGYGHFERCYTRGGGWRIKCVKCASGRDIGPDDPGVHWAENEYRHQMNLLKKKQNKRQNKKGQ